MSYSRKIMQLEIEEAALKKEDRPLESGTSGRHLQKELAELRDEFATHESTVG